MRGGSAAPTPILRLRREPAVLRTVPGLRRRPSRPRLSVGLRIGLSALATLLRRAIGRAGAVVILVGPLRAAVGGGRFSAVGHVVRHAVGSGCAGLPFALRVLA